MTNLHGLAMQKHADVTFIAMLLAQKRLEKQVPGAGGHL